MWAVYDRPEDLPRHFVFIRLMADKEAVNVMVTAKTLEDVRGNVPPGSTRIPTPGNNAKIAEI
jgi:hypothetical protein